MPKKKGKRGGKKGNARRPQHGRPGNAQGPQINVPENESPEEELGEEENVPENELAEELGDEEIVPENEVPDELGEGENVPENELPEELGEVENVPENEPPEEPGEVENIPENEAPEQPPSPVRYQSPPPPADNNYCWSQAVQGRNYRGRGQQRHAAQGRRQNQNFRGRAGARGRYHVQEEEVEEEGWDQPLQGRTNNAPVEPAATEQEVNDAYYRLTLRGMEALNSVTRAILEQFVMHGQLHYDAVLPQKDRSSTQEGYKSEACLEVNMFPLTIDTKEIFSYSLDWQPASAVSKSSIRSWRVKAWTRACEEAKRLWNGSGLYNVTPPAYGLGAWDLGPNLYRHEEIPETVLENERLNPLTWQSVHQRKHETWDTTLRTVELYIPKQRCEILQTDMTDLITNGGDYSKFVKLRVALQAIFYVFPAWIRGWIEDARTGRLFYPTGYWNNQHANQQELDLVQDFVFHPPEASDNQLFVFRRGYHAAARLYPGGVYVNIWSCYAPFFTDQMTIDNAMLTVLVAKGIKLNKRPLPLKSWEIKWLESLLHVRVKTKLTKKVFEYKDPETYPARYYRICGFSQYPCRTLNVPIYTRDRKGELTKHITRWTNFLDFCEQRYANAFLEWPEIRFRNINNTLLDLPAVKVRDDLECYFPPWALEIKENDKHGVKSVGILSSFAYKMRNILYEQKGANEVIDFLSGWVKTWTSMDETLPTFKINIDPRPLELVGCVLPAPTQLMLYSYDQGTLMRVNATRFKWNRWPWKGLRQSNLGMSKYADVKDYMILRFAETTQGSAFTWIENFLSVNCISADQFRGLHNDTPFIYCLGDLQSTSTEKFEEEVLKAMQDYRTRKNSAQAVPDAVFLMMPFRDLRRGLYDAFKFICDMTVGVTSQVLVVQTWDKFTGNRLRDAMVNMLLKFNKKLGGRNIVVRSPFVEERYMPGTMIFGADVTHAGAVCNVSHSIASIVGTVDMPPRTYAAQVRIQHTDQEIIQETEDMVADLVATFHRNNPGVVLERVFFFRDGVGQQQFGDVLSLEVPAIFRGIIAGGGDGRAKLVHLICIKRHHTRFKDVVDKEIQPGVAVNDLPVYPLQTSFYLCSHLHPPPWLLGKRQGSCRSTFYHLLLDQLGLTLPELQTMMYHLCFTYEKCANTLSMVPANQYAHLACSRGRIHYQELKRTDLRIESRFPKVEQAWGTPYPPDVITRLDVHPNLRNTMYYL